MSAGLPLEAAAWCLLGVLSLTLCLQAARERDQSPPLEPPSPLPRTATHAELRSLEALSASLNTRLERAHQALGRPLRLEELESDAPDGEPWLGGPIPDNPLQPGMSSVRAGCSGQPEELGAQHDWWYCAEDNSLTPVLPVP